MTLQRAKVAIVVVDANDASGLSHGDPSRPSPVLHPAVHNLIEGLKEKGSITVEVIYGKRDIPAGEDRWDGNIHYVPVRYKSHLRGRAGSSFLSRTISLVRHISQSHPDIVHGQGTERESVLVAALSGRPSVATLHGNFRELSRTLGNSPFSHFGLCALMETLTLPKVSIVHCISAHTRRSVSSLARKTKVIPNAVAEGFFRVLAQPAKNPKIVCVSGITEWKDPLALVDAGHQLRDQFPETELHFYGACYESHPYGRRFMDRISNLGWCVFHGTQPPDTIAQALASATCSVLPSRQENFGLALAEAMAAGVAVVGSATGGIPDVIEDGVTGRLFPPGDSTALAQILIQLHEDRTLLARFAAAGREHARRHFTADSVAQSHLEMYQELLACG